MKRQTTSPANVESVLQRMDLLHTVSQKISEKKPLPELLDEIMESSKLVLDAAASSLLLYSKEDGKLHFQVVRGESGEALMEHTVDVGTGIAGWVAQNRKALLIPDCYQDKRFSPDYDKKSAFKTRCMICVPLLRKGQLLGVMQVINKKDNGVFDDFDLKIFETLAGQCAIAIENARLIDSQIESEALERELERAREIQQALLPSRLPEYSDLSLAARLIPARQVGGDYYNVIRINQEQSLFVVADVSGKGVPAALIVSTIYSCLQTYLSLNRSTFDLVQLVNSLNRILIDSTTPEKFATCWFGLYHHQHRTLTSINAGHNPPYVFRQGLAEPIELKAGGLMLGAVDFTFEQEHLELQPGDVLLYFTDGVTEAWNMAEEEYEEERLIKIAGDNLASHCHTILAAITEDVRGHVGRAEQSDDFTCVVVKIR